MSAEEDEYDIEEYLDSDSEELVIKKEKVFFFFFFIIQKSNIFA